MPWTRFGGKLTQGLTVRVTDRRRPLADAY